MFNGISRRVRRPVTLTAIIAVGAIAASAGTAYAVTSIVAGPTQPAGTVYACVASGGKLAYLESGSVPQACPKGDSRWKWDVTGPKGATGTKGATGAAGPAGPAGPQGPAGTYTPVEASAITSITNYPDVGNHGIWAADTITRDAMVIKHGAVSVSHCGGNSTNGITSCYYYTASIADSGTFQTNIGGNSPNAGVKINAVVSGSLNGGSDFEFYATSPDPSASNVPGTDNFPTSGLPPTQDWPEVFFPDGTGFGQVNEINWSNTYNAPGTCETWIDAYNNGSGTADGAGDITGVNACGG
jgi:hypothetical protein